MKFLELLRVSLRALRANKLRSMLTMLGIIIGVAAVIAMVGIGNGATASITSQIQGLGSNLLIVSPGQSSSGGVKGAAGSSNTLVMTDIAKIEAAGSAVKGVAPFVSSNVQAVYGSGNASTSVAGTTAAYAEVRNLQIAQGRFLTQEDVTAFTRVAVVGPTVVKNLMGDENAQIIGKTIKLKNIPFLVVGVTASQGSSGFTNNDDVVYIPITTAQDRLIGNKYLRQIFIEASSPQMMATAQNQVTYVLRSAHKLQDSQADDFTITNQADVLQTMEGVTKTLTMLLGGIAAISLLVGGIGIMNIMLVSVTERTREIGIRKAIGAKGRDILVQFLIEAVVLSIVGGGIGILLGWGGSILVGKLMSMATSVSMTSVLLAFGFSAGIGIVFGVFPAKKAANMDPIDALRYE
ncbi:ABC transporter permease [Desulfitobacterium metallireducens]|uniref:Multidrug ABC transporter substrate-binding protein n=1 Tax=Desulfitobacterium metallireducens DSM 15288 TaxID=871968 RepID=W0EEN7_9FIRM|nr:ABC transporter permease [Desulfitobacterium metallireducens]AHF07988.1 multidrug ABC transporter substrate-binding protein [Desulfitobacterium metallireducens DSM 15288]